MDVVSVSSSSDDEDAPPPVPAPAPVSMFPPPMTAALRQSTLYKVPTARHRLVATKITNLFDEITRLRAGGLNVLVYPLNKFHPTSRESDALQVRHVFEDRPIANIDVHVIETKKDCSYYNLGYCEIFGILTAAKEAAEELRTPTTGVIVASTQCGDACKFFVKLVLASAKSAATAKKFKAKPASSKPRATHLVEFASLYQKTDADKRHKVLEDYYYLALESI